MDNTLFETDAAKVDCISRLLRQADEMLGDVKTHLLDYGQRLGTDPAPDQEQSSQIEIERLKQVALEKTEDARVARFERVQALDEVQSLREAVATLQAKAEGAETIRKREIDSTEQQTIEINLPQQQAKVLQIENSRLTKEIESLKRRLERAHEQNERLLRTREELLDTLKLSNVSVTKPHFGPDAPEAEADQPEESLLFAKPEDPCA